MPSEVWQPYWGGIDKPSGLYHKYLVAVSEAIGVQIVYRGYDSFEDLFTALENHEIDITIGFAHTEKRKARFNFSLPLFNLKKVAWVSDASLLKHPPSSWNWVCIENGAECDVIKKLGAEKINYASRLNVAAQMLKHNIANATVTTVMEVSQYILQPEHSSGRVVTDYDLGRNYIGLMMAKDRDDLKKEIDQAITVNQLEFESIKLSNVYLLNDQTHWQLLQHQQGSKTIRYTISENAYPLSYRNPKTKQLSGYIHDLLKLMENKSLFHFEYIPANNRDIEEMLANGLVDILPGRSIHDINTKKYLSTTPFTDINHAFIETRAPYSQRRLALLDRTGTLTKEIKLLREIEDLVVYNRSSLLLKDIIAGKITHALVDQDIVDNHLYHNYEMLFRVVPKPEQFEFTTPLAIQMRKDSLYLHNMLNSLLEITSREEICALRNDHAQLLIHYGYNKDIVWSYVLLAGLAAALLTIGAAAIVYKLIGHLKSTQTINRLSQKEIHWLSTLLDSMPSIIFITNNKNQIIFSNEAYKSHYEQCKVSLSDCSGAHCKLVSSAIELESGCILTNHNDCCPCNERYFQVRHQDIVHPELGGNHRMTIVDDVTDEKIHEQELSESNQRAMQAIEARNQFLAVVSHELRTPIAAMMGLMELLQFNLTNPQNAELLRNAIQSAQRLSSQVNDILDFSKIEAQQLQLNIRGCNIYHELCPTLRSFDATALLNNVEFVLDWKPSNIVTANMDALRVNQVIINVLSNALKFTKQGSIHVTIIVDAKHITITVTDTGCGMSESQLSTVFEPFVQAEKDISRRFGGTGLGMSITKNLLTLMNGDITMTSKLDHGTTVTCRLPIEGHPLNVQDNFVQMPSCPASQQWLSLWQGKENTLSAETHLPAETAQPQFANLYPDTLFDALGGQNNDLASDIDKRVVGISGHVLVADDDNINQMLLRRQLTLLGVQFHIASDGVSALEYLTEHAHDVDLVLTDCHMPHMNGFELTKAVKSQHELFGDIPVIGCTAEDSRTMSEKATLSGMDHVIYKPYTFNQLNRVLSLYLKTEKIKQPNDPRFNWLKQGTPEEQLEMAIVVRDSFTKEIQSLNNESKETSHIIHRIKGSSAVLEIQPLIELTTRYEQIKDEQQQLALKHEILAELKMINLHVEHWLLTQDC
ncbi:response regulator [Vibrio sinensis]|uniref:histidine kinase n=2 Tax=Vibrio sinensis TaxID=2302434 RepID=A0A3A6RGC8_9VIBR|nr:response regulator [Vibrio sinensis]